MIKLFHLRVCYFGLALLLTILFLIHFSELAIAQCTTNHVTHLNGSKLINGVNVTVSSTGKVDSLNYCTSTFPYLVGANSVSGGGQGTYTFNFLPAVDTVTLNFSGISYTNTGHEIIVLSVNGAHYSIPSAGSSNGCNPLAVLTTSGDITACTGCPTSGWSGTRITGPINSISIFDSVVAGLPNGSLFSLFFCGKYAPPNPTGTVLNGSIYPNPFHNILNVALNESKTAKIVIYDITAREIFNQFFTQSVILNTNSIASGVYVYKIIYENKILKKGKLIKL